MRTDAQLLVAARTDAHAFRELYDRYAERIHRFHAGRTRDFDAALDLTAETFAQAWLARLRFEDRADGSAAPWLFAIARHVLVASVRRSRLERAACERLGVMSALDRPQVTTEPSEEWLAGLDDALLELTPDERQAIGLRVVDGLSYDDVGRAAGTTPGAARVRVHRALLSLRQRLLNPKEVLR